MELCSKCKVVERLPYHYYCKNCHNAESREFYKRNPEARKRTPEKNKEYRDKYSDQVRQVIREAKEGKPCMDCGQVYPYYVMDFDHVRGVKVINLGKMTKHYGIPSALEEIAKCDLVCSNCHRIRTFNRRGIGN